MIYTLPNIITILRFLISPIFIILLLNDSTLFVQLACILFVLGAISDFLDGWIARKNKSVTQIGVFLDPLADKFLTSSAFIAFSIMGLINWWMVTIVIIRDLGTTLLRLYADSIKKSIVTSYSAKLKTFLQMVFIIFILTLIYLSKMELGNVINKNISSLIDPNYLYYPMLFLTIFTIWTAFEYILQNKKLLFDLIKKN
jgi:CDP-diacylglycerol---glycerol-3-phosphate 3-phosphatidyltransferase